MPGVHVVPATDLTPLERLGQEYIEDRMAAGLSPRTIQGDLRPRLERIFLPWCSANGITEPHQLDQRAINRWSNHLLAVGGAKGKLSPHSVTAYVKTANSFLAWMRRQGEQVPGQAHKPKVPRRDVEVLTDEEIKAMVRLASLRDKLIVELLAQSGIRASELTDLRVVDLVEKEVALLDGRREKQHGVRILAGKGDRERFVPIPSALFRRLRSYAHSRGKDVSTDRLFISNRRSARGEYEPLSRSGLEQMIRFLGKQALGRERTYPHLFRHSYISKLVRAGIDSTVIRRYVGHSSSQLIDQVYGHLRPEHTAAAVLAALD